MEQKIKDYLYFHLPLEDRKALSEYLSDNHHYETDPKKIVHFTGSPKTIKIVPLIELRAMMVSPEFKYEDGKELSKPKVISE